jgi:ribosome-binding protein aMBF1 (putative translation factor)
MIGKALQGRLMANKHPVTPSADEIAAARLRAEKTRRQLEHKPGPAELLTPQELADGAPFYFVLCGYVRQLKEAREAAGLTIMELSNRTGLAAEMLSRLEAGALTNPAWKTLGTYAAALGLRPRLVLEGFAGDYPIPEPTDANAAAIK